MITNQNDKELTSSLLFDDPNVPDQDALDIRFKKYLLRDSDFTEEDVGEIEELMIDDERYFERMMLVESELTENFVRGALSADETERFEKYFLTTPERKKKLELVKLSVSGSAKSPEVGETETEQPESAPSWWKSIFAFLDSSNLLAGFAAAVVVLLFLSISAIWWLSRSGDTSIAVAPANQSAQNSNVNSYKQTEIARANKSEDFPTPRPSAAESPASQKTPNSVQTPKEIEKPKPSAESPTPQKTPNSVQIPKKGEGYDTFPGNRSAKHSLKKPPKKESTFVDFELLPGETRSVKDDGDGKKIAPNTKTVRLELIFNKANDFEDFLVVIKDSEGHEIARRGNLKKSENGRFLTVEFPAEKFKPDTYTVHLSGRKNGAYTSLSDYSLPIPK